MISFFVRNPSWVDWNFEHVEYVNLVAGVTLCENWAGIHREFAEFKGKIKFLDDEFSAEEEAMVMAKGNEWSNTNYLPSLPEWYIDVREYPFK